MAEKTYRTHRLNLSVAWDKPTGVGDKTKSVTLSFAPAGSLTTDDEAEQAYIESLPTFKDGQKVDGKWVDGTIYLDSPAEQIAAASAKASALRAVANKAEAEAVAAEGALAALVKAAEPAAKA